MIAIGAVFGLFAGAAFWFLVAAQARHVWRVAGAIVVVMALLAGFTVMAGPPGAVAALGGFMFSLPALLIAAVVLGVED